MKGILLWAIGIPLPLVILAYLFNLDLSSALSSAWLRRPCAKVPIEFAVFRAKKEA